MQFEHQKTNDILKWFGEIAKIPRCSKHEQKICQWLLNWAQEQGFESDMDTVGNIVIRVPGTGEYTDSPPVVIQGHVDMVCEKTPDSDHDFSKDPIKLVFEDDWLTADKTSLGADNGIAIAMALSLAMDSSIPHPPLELLFTVDEETGLTGANALKPGFIKGKTLINLDSEDEGYFTVGCAGGINTYLSVPVKREQPAASDTMVRLSASGMKGGHSGIDIDAEKANAIHVLGRALHYLSSDSPLKIANIKGGSAHNAIPRDAQAVIAVPGDSVDQLGSKLGKLEAEVKKEYAKTEPGLRLTLEDSGKTDSGAVIPVDDSEKVIRFLLAVPHGVAAMSVDIENLVETSNNFASVEIDHDELKALTSQRSSLVSRLQALTHRIESVARLAGGKANSGDGYPPWQPNMESPLLKKSVDLYKRMFDKKPVVEVIHAGLECGIIGDKNPGMDMISIGPTLKYPHSPDEKIQISTIGKVWDFLLELLKELK